MLIIKPPMFKSINAKGFTFLNLPIDISETGSIDLGYGYIIRLADDIEKESIEFFLNKHIYPLSTYNNLYNLSLLKNLPQGVLYESKAVSDTYYVVLECPVHDGYITILDIRIKTALRLFHRHLYELFIVYYARHGSDYVPSRTTGPLDNQRILNIAEPIHFASQPE